MTYKLEPIDAMMDYMARKENYHELKAGERLRCQACNSIYWRVFYDRAQCMGCRSITRVVVEKTRPKAFGDLRDVTWITWQVNKFKDGRVRDPITKRSEFVVYKNLLKARIGGTEFLIYPQLLGSWFYGRLEEKFKQMTPSQILKYLQNSLV